MTKRCKARSTAPAEEKPPAPVDHAAKPKGEKSEAKDGGKTPAANTGLMRVTSNQCGASKAVAKPTKTSGPNGDIHWLTCGITAGGWTPPKVTIADLHTVSLDSVIDNGLFKPCKPYLSVFDKYANKYGLPPILVASIAMQESTCNPNTVGGNGEQGLMQLTTEKCPGGKAGSACRTPDYNVNTGAKYIKDTLDKNDGNILLTIGGFNGWEKGMTTSTVAKMKSSYGCRAQQNLDYLQQVFNGYLQGIDPFSMDMGFFYNLKC